MHNPRKDAPSFHRNIAPIKSKLYERLDGSVNSVLEIGCGTGQHVTELAQQFPQITFYPTDKEQENTESTDEWVRSANLQNVRAARVLDVTNPGPDFIGNTLYDVILCFNVIHISPWAVTDALFRLANKVSSANTRVFLYGPFRIQGEHTSESNRSCEDWLKSQSSEFGVRSIEDVSHVAEMNGFLLSIRHEMPSNNFLMAFCRGNF